MTRPVLRYPEAYQDPHFKGSLIEPSWPLIVGICGMLEGSWGVLGRVVQGFRV